MTAPEPREDVAVAEVLAAHYATGVELTTPRQYTARGGWNVICTCGDVIGETDDDDIESRHNAHVAEALAPLIAERERVAVERARDESAVAEVGLTDAEWTRLRHAAGNRVVLGPLAEEVERILGERVREAAVEALLPVEHVPYCPTCGALPGHQRATRPCDGSILCNSVRHRDDCKFPRADRRAER